MKYSRRVEVFEKVRAEYALFLLSVLWKLTGDRELFTEAMQYALLGMWKNIEKLNSQKAGAYIYRIALSANSRAWRNRIGRNGQIALPQVSEAQISTDKDPAEKISNSELAQIVRQAISKLPAKQSRAIVIRYLEQHDYKSVAEKLSCTEAAARSNVSKAIATLKSKLANLTKGDQ